MNINSISLSRFSTFCQQLEHTSKIERIQIIGNGQGEYLPVLTSKPGWIEKILRFFGFKKWSLRINEVAQTTLDWFRYCSLKNPQLFVDQWANIQKLTPILKKVNREYELQQIFQAATLLAYRQQKIDHIQQAEQQLATENQQQLVALQRHIPLHEFRLIWPPGIADAYGNQQISEITDRIYKIINILYQQPTTTISRARKTKNIILYYPDGKTEIFKFPFKIDFYLNRKIKRILIKDTVVIAQGAMRQIRQAYDILNGQQFVSKPWCSMERSILTAIHGDRDLATTGFMPEAIERSANRYYENFGTDLRTFLASNSSTSPLLRARFTLHLLYGLQRLHDLKFTPSNIPFYHGDIKSANCLIYHDMNGSPQAALSDFDSTGIVHTIVHTLFFRSPELIRHVENSKLTTRSAQEQVNENSNHNKLYGQSNDIWALGLVILFILSNGETLTGAPNTGIPNLDCYSKQLNSHLLMDPPDFWVQTLFQTALDTSIDQLAQRHDPQSELAPFWELARQMLQVDAAQRIKAEDAFQIAQKAYESL